MLQTKFLIKRHKKACSSSARAEDIFSIMIVSGD
jgi:hypothetical protein